MRRVVPVALVAVAVAFAPPGAAVPPAVECDVTTDAGAARDATEAAPVPIPVGASEACAGGLGWAPADHVAGGDAHEALGVDNGEDWFVVEVPAGMQVASVLAWGGCADYEAALYRLEDGGRVLQSRRLAQGACSEGVLTGGPHGAAATYLLGMHLDGRPTGRAYSIDVIVMRTLQAGCGESDDLGSGRDASGFAPVDLGLGAPAGSGCADHLDLADEYAVEVASGATTRLRLHLPATPACGPVDLMVYDGPSPLAWFESPGCGSEIVAEWTAPRSGRFRVIVWPWAGDVPYTVPYGLAAETV